MAEGRLARFAGGLGLGYLHTLAVLVVGLWLTPFLLRQLGSHDYGLWLLASQVLVYLALMDFGVVALVPREVAFAMGQRPRPARHPSCRIRGRSGRRRRPPHHRPGDMADACGRRSSAAVAVWLLPADWDLLRRPVHDGGGGVRARVPAAGIQRSSAGLSGSRVPRSGSARGVDAWNGHDCRTCARRRGPLRARRRLGRVADCCRHWSPGAAWPRAFPKRCRGDSRGCHGRDWAVARPWHVDQRGPDRPGAFSGTDLVVVGRCSGPRPSCPTRAPAS